MPKVNIRKKSASKPKSQGMLTHRQEVERLSTFVGSLKVLSGAVLEELGESTFKINERDLNINKLGQFLNGYKKKDVVMKKVQLFFKEKKGRKAKKKKKGKKGMKAKKAKN